MNIAGNFPLTDPLAALLGEWAVTLNPYSVLLRVFMVVLLASIIGCERSSKRHSAGLRTFVLIAFSATTAMLSGNSILFSSRGQIKGLTTSVGLWACVLLGFAVGAGLYTVTLIVFVFLLCILMCFPSFEIYLLNRSNHFEIHLELKGSFYLRDFVTVSRRLGLRIDDIESNPAYSGSGLSVYTITFTICSSELKKYKTHHQIIEALQSLDYIYHIEEIR